MTIGILDPKGEQKNPLTGNAYSDQYKELAKVWSGFPAYKNASKNIKDILDNQIILVVSGTGSGKTVLFPKFLLHALNYDGKIAITLPKQMLAASAADFAAKTLDVKLGEEVGYQFRGDSKKSGKTKLLYATDGTIVARLLGDPELRDFNAVVIDEAHERKIQIDFLLYLLKAVVQKRPDFKLIIMSATINADIFRVYFDKFKFKQVEISSETHYPIESIFLTSPITDKEYIDTGVKIIDNIIKTDPSDILFFVTSVNETINTCRIIGSNTKMIASGTTCVEVYSGIDKDKQEFAQSVSLYKDRGYRVKLVVSTNVAESSLTIDGIKYVIDSGLELFSYFDPDTRSKRLDKSMITKAQAKQRMGRAGRTAPGVCYHLYTEQQFKDMKEYPEPSIRTSDITDECLQLIKHTKTVDQLIKTLGEFIEPPREKYIKHAINSLISMKLIDMKNTTVLGELVQKIRGFDYQQTIALICGVKYRCSHELLSIFCAIDACKGSIGELFNTPERAMEIMKLSEDKLPKLVEERKKFIKKFRSPYGDFQSILKIYESFRKKHIEQKQFDIFYSVSTLMKALKHRKRVSIRRDISEDDIKEDHLKLLGITPEKDAKIQELNIDDRIALCLVVGFRNNLATKIQGKSLYEVANVKQTYSLQRDSFLAEHEPSSLIFRELFISSGKTEIKIASCIPKLIKDILR